jgi:hypothetical protein
MAVAGALYPDEELYPSEDLYPTDDPPRIALGFEYPPDDLAWRVDPPNGRPSRWAADEPLTENVASDMRLVDEMPGGDKEGSVLLARNPRESFPDLTPFSEISVYGPGVEEIANYRLDKTPESDGDRVSITVEAVGWSKALEDDNALIGPGFIDSDLGKWGEPSIERRLHLINAAYQPAAASASPGLQDAGSAAPGILFDFNGVTKVAGLNPGTELAYYGGGVDLGLLLYDFIGDGTTTWSEVPALSSDDLWSSFDGSTNLNGTSANQQGVAATILGRKYAMLQAFYTGAFLGQMTNKHRFQNVKVLGAHGLAPVGTWPNIGFTARQMLGYAIPLHTPLIANPEDLEDTGYIIQQAWFSDPGPMSQVVQELTKYELLDWFVFGEKRFKLKRPGTYGRRWQAYAGPSGLQEQGFDAARSWSKILVTGQDVDGRSISVGPLGSGATVETPELEETDPDHPAVRAGVDRMDRLDLRGVSTPARMTEAGEIWLREANRLNRSGSATLSGYVMDDRGVMRPVSQVRAGDEVRFPDASDPSYRRIVRRSYEHNTRTTTLDLDAPPEGLQALLERLQADIQALALS